MELRLLLGNIIPAPTALNQVTLHNFGSLRNVSGDTLFHLTVCSEGVQLIAIDQDLNFRNLSSNSGISAFMIVVG